MDHLIHAGRPADEQRRHFIDIVTSDPLVGGVLDAAATLDLPDWWLVSGALYNTVWNTLTGRPSGFGIKDADLFYFDDGDLSYDAEDKVISNAAARFSHLPVPVEIRNQARVHLWFPDKFGGTYPQLRSGRDGIALFASKTHAVGIRKSQTGAVELHAPFGLDDVFSFRITPNTALDNRQTHLRKAARAKSHWPEVSIEPWPDDPD